MNMLKQPRPPRTRQPTRRERINALKKEACRLAGGTVESYISPHCSEDIEESFWAYVIDFEKRQRGLADTPERTVAEELTRSSVQLPPPEELGDEALRSKLWEVIRALAGRRYFLCSTDHLSDRALYLKLWLEALREPYEPVATPQSACVIDLISSGSEEDIHDYLKYYAGEQARSGWKREFPETEIPEAEPLPFDRDRMLPAPSWQDRGVDDAEGGDQERRAAGRDAGPPRELQGPGRQR